MPRLGIPRLEGGRSRRRMNIPPQPRDLATRSYTRWGTLTGSDRGEPSLEGSKHCRRMNILPQTGFLATRSYPWCTLTDGSCDVSAR